MVIYIFILYIYQVSLTDRIGYILKNQFNYTCFKLWKQGDKKRNLLPMVNLPGN